MSEPLDDWPCNIGTSPIEIIDLEDSSEPIKSASESARKGEAKFSFPCDMRCEDDDDITKTKIRTFLEEKALDLKKLQTPLYEEFINTSNPPSNSPRVGNICRENVRNSARLPPKSKPSPSKVVSGTSTPTHVDVMSNNVSPMKSSRLVLCAEVESKWILREIPSSRLNEWGELLQDAQQSCTKHGKCSHIPWFLYLEYLVYLHYSTFMAWLLEEFTIYIALDLLSKTLGS